MSRSRNSKATAMLIFCHSKIQNLAKYSSFSYAILWVNDFITLKSIFSAYVKAKEGIGKMTCWGFMKMLFWFIVMVYYVIALFILFLLAIFFSNCKLLIILYKYFYYCKTVFFAKLCCREKGVLSHYCRVGTAKGTNNELEKEGGSLEEA